MISQTDQLLFVNFPESSILSWGKEALKLLDHMKTDVANQPAKYSTDLLSVLPVNLERTLQLSRQVMLKWKRVMSAVATKWLIVICSWHKWMFQKEFSSSNMVVTTRDCNLHDPLISYMVKPKHDDFLLNTALTLRLDVSFLSTRLLLKPCL